jgi:hypothetical protein
VKKVFPSATPGREFGVDGWSIARPKGAPRPAREGTMPSDRIMIGVVERKAGPTLYVWYPGGDVHGLAAHPGLAEAGFKVMVGCLVFTKKQPYPFDAVEGLLRALKAKDAAKR